MSPGNPLGGKPRSNCKICRAGEETLSKINGMMLDQVPYSQIIAEFPELNLNTTNLSHHKNHFHYKDKAVELYKKEQEVAAIKTVGELKALDDVYSKMYHYLATCEIQDEPPRRIEVCGNLMISAIKTKAELMLGDQKPGNNLEHLMALLINRGKKEPKVIDAEFSSAAPGEPDVGSSNAGTGLPE